MTFDISVIIDTLRITTEALSKMGDILIYMQGLSLSGLNTFVHSAPFQVFLEALKALPLV